MVLKRIISCLAIISVVLLMSCYDVSYDKDNGVLANSASGNWTDGLTTKQIVEGMEVKANFSSGSKCEDCPEEVLELVWVLPVYLPGTWTVFAIGVDGTKKIVATNGDVTTKPIDGYYKSICFIKFFITTEYLTTFEVCLTDANNKTYTNIISFAVFPNNANIRITIDPKSERAANTTLAGFWQQKEWELYCEKEEWWVPISIEANAITTSNAKAFVPVVFRIISDLRLQGLGFVKHYSNSSFCKTTRLTPTATNVLAAFEFKFEDLPLEQLHNEPDGSYDYDDVIFKVEVLK